MTRLRVIVVRTGTANLASILAGLRRAGADPTVSEDLADVRAAEWLVLPGVGAFGPAMQQLAEHNLIAVLAERVRVGRPTLAVCLGLQLLAESSDESPGVAGLGVLPAHVMRFPDTVRVPQIGWNEVEAGPAAVLQRSGYAYFANSYRLVEPPAGWSAAFAEHGGRFVAALERGAVLACQFHPELSGQWGLNLLRRWLQRGAEGGAAC
jgi:imidazole glycerol-phosphate synthase subunit HisH